MKNWKIGAVAGLIAGIVAGIVAIITGINLINMGFFYWEFPQPTMIRIVTVEIVTNTILGVILGVIYSKLNEMIPGKDVSKGLLYGLILSLLYCIRWSTLSIMYGYMQTAITWSVYIIPLISYGFVLGVFYEILCNRYHVPKLKKIIGHDITGGIYPGAIAGLIGGIPVEISNILIFNRHLWSIYLSEICVLIGQLGTHLFFNMIWGIVFGILFVVFYEKIPGIGIPKGLIFSMIMFLISSFRSGIFILGYGDLMLGLWQFTGGFTFLFFGILLGYLYKK